VAGQGLKEKKGKSMGKNTTGKTNVGASGRRVAKKSGTSEKQNLAHEEREKTPLRIVWITRKGSHFRRESLPNRVNE